MEAIHNTYLVKALDNYSYDLSEAIEALNYALSYDEKNPIALALMAKFYREQLKDYNTAKQYYEQALAEDIDAVSVYPDYISLLIWTEEFDKAEKLIAFALTIKGIDKALIHYYESYLFEYKREFKLALKALKEAKLNTYNAGFLYDINQAKTRIKDKMPKQKKKKNQKSKTKDKSKKQ